MTRMGRFHIRGGAFAVLLITFLLAPAPVEAQASRLSLERQAREALPSVITQIDVERRLLDQDLESYEAARALEIQRRARVEELSQEIDTLLAGPSPTLSDLAEAQASLDAATLAAEQTAEQVDELRRSLTERLRRIALLEDDLRILSRADPGARSPISGTWEVDYQPAGLTTGSPGVFELDVDGSVVEGSYRFGEARSGAIRGTYGGSTLQLELLDSTRGLDAIFQGRYDPAEGTLRGFWQPTELGAGEPGGGSWSARKVDDEDIDLDLEE